MAAVASVGINVETRGAKQRLRSLTQEANKTQRAFAGIQGAVTKLAGALALVGTARFVFAKTAELEKQTKSLEVLTGSLQKANNIIKDLQQFAAVTPFTSADLIETAKRLKAFGVDTSKLVDTTKRLGDVAGATGAELNGIATAYGQIQAKGKLQTEELLQLQERGVDLASTLKKEYNLTGEEFSKALQKGQISAQAVEFALKRLTDTGGQYANGAIAQSSTLSGKLSTLQDGVENIARVIGKKLSPVLKDVLDQAISVVDNINRAFAAASLTDEQRQKFKEKAERTVARKAGGGLLGPGGPFGAGKIKIRYKGKTYQGDASGVVSKITNDLINNEIQRQVEAGRGAAAKSGAGLQATLPDLTNGGGTGGAGEERVDLSQKVYDLELKRLEARKTGNKLQEIFLGKEIAIARIKEQGLKPRREALRIALAEQDALESAGQLLTPIYEGAQELQKAAAELGKEVAEAFIKFDDEQIAKRLEEQAQRINQVYASIGNTITTGIVDSLTAAVDGTKELADVASDVLRNVANILIQFGVQSFLGGLGGGNKDSIFTKLFGGGRANGGPVSSNRSYLVGERGPELFVPKSSGTIVPNGSLGGGMANVTVNVDASGSNVQGDSNQASQLGKAIGAAVQAELVKQKRPGGLLAGV